MSTLWASMRLTATPFSMTGALQSCSSSSPTCLSRKCSGLSTKRCSISALMLRRAPRAAAVRMAAFSGDPAFMCTLGSSTGAERSRVPGVERREGGEVLSSLSSCWRQLLPITTSASMAGALRSFCCVSSRWRRVTPLAVGSTSGSYINWCSWARRARCAPRMAAVCSSCRRGLPLPTCTPASQAGALRSSQCTGCRNQCAEGALLRSSLSTTGRGHLRRATPLATTGALRSRKSLRATWCSRSHSGWLVIWEHRAQCSHPLGTTADVCMLCMSPHLSIMAAGLELSCRVVRCRLLGQR
mmetsp:Transcript_31134/g.68033  ORF Transcript_31134/g.68033 Transcript_31134/m.68033 type:complete len:299 (+) Transcript_31134:712-1608(+)